MDNAVWREHRQPVKMRDRVVSTVLDEIVDVVLTSHEVYTLRRVMMDFVVSAARAMLAMEFGCKAMDEDAV